MARTSPKQRRRQRTLSDDELRAVWRAAGDSPNAFSYLVQFLLLTATRRNEAAHMKRGEVSGDEWTIPQERYKTGLELVVPLSSAGRAVLDKVPKVGKSGFVFTTDGKHPIAGFSKFKRAFDAKVLAELGKQDPEAKPLPNWTLHDLRRTARSMMSRAGVPTDHAERCLGHVIGGVRGVCDNSFVARPSLITDIRVPSIAVVPRRSRVTAAKGQRTFARARQATSSIFSRPSNRDTLGQSR
jgi:integrase